MRYLNPGCLHQRQSVEEPTKFGRMYAGTAVDWTTLAALTGATGRFSGDDLIDAVTKLQSAESEGVR